MSLLTTGGRDNGGGAGGHAARLPWAAEPGYIALKFTVLGAIERSQRCRVRLSCLDVSSPPRSYGVFTSSSATLDATSSRTQDVRAREAICAHYRPIPCPRPEFLSETFWMVKFAKHVNTRRLAPTAATSQCFEMYTSNIEARAERRVRRHVHHPLILGSSTIAGRCPTCRFSRVFDIPVRVWTVRRAVLYMTKRIRASLNLYGGREKQLRMRPPFHHRWEILPENRLHRMANLAAQTQARGH